MSQLSFKEFANGFSFTQHELRRDHGSIPMCRVMHKEAGLGQTPLDDETKAQLAAMAGESPMGNHDDGGLNDTKEHLFLHMFLAGVVVQARLMGVPTEEMLAAMYVIGRRQGRKEAVEMLNTDATPEDFLGDLTGP